MTNRPTHRALGLVVGLLLVTTACGSSSDGVEEESLDTVGAEIDDVADDAEEASSAFADTLRANGLESLASAVQEIDFRELTDSPEFTFFAPDDEAFQTLEASDIADLLADPDRLSDVLRNHLVGESLDASEIGELDSVETEGGSTLDVAVDDDVVMVSGAVVVRSDIEVDDGVIHVVDRIFVDA